MKYNKLVRDKIPEIIAKNNATPITHIADDLEYWDKLKEKLTEEVNEFFADESIEELADIMEVLLAINTHKGFTSEEIEKKRQDKKTKRGGFLKKIILEGTKEN